MRFSDFRRRRPATAQDRPTSRRALLDSRGVYQTEYTLVLVLVALVAAVAIAMLSAPLVEYHDAVVRFLDTPLM